MQAFKIRDIVIDPPLVLAPVAGHTDTLFRQVIKSLGGCGLVVSELVSTEAMTRNQDRTAHLVRFDPLERPVSIQIFGCDPDRMAESASIVERSGADIVDINLGCPVKKVVRQGGGSNLLRDLPLLERIFRAVRKAVAIPVTVKIRSGWDRKSINAVEVLHVAENCGLEGLTIHGRTREEMFSGEADWSIIAEVKRQARIPIIGNGDVFQPQDAVRMFRETGVDGVMMGRGVLTNPWLLRQSFDYLTQGLIVAATRDQKLDFVSRFLQRVREEANPKVALGKMKKMGGYLSKGLNGGARLRDRIHACKTPEEVMASIDDFRADRTQAGSSEFG
jgi:tRNA-dihydrouridine synthase B